MTTVRQLERLWNEGLAPRLAVQLLAGRPEGSPALSFSSSNVALAAMAMIRLDELGQTFHPFYLKLLRFVLASQEHDGGWRDPATTALVLRALLADKGHGLAIDRGMVYLANLQKDDGLWPAEPLRRMPGEWLVTAHVLHQLGADGRFRASVRMHDAMCAFGQNEPKVDEEARRLWDSAKLRCRRPLHDAALPFAVAELAGAA